MECKHWFNYGKIRDLAYLVGFAFLVILIFFIPRGSFSNNYALIIVWVLYIATVLILEYKAKKQKAILQYYSAEKKSLIRNRHRTQEKFHLWLVRNHRKIISNIFWYYFLFIIVLFVFNLDGNRLISFIFWFLLGIKVGSYLTHKAIDKNSNNRNIPH